MRSLTQSEAADLNVATEEKGQEKRFEFGKNWQHFLAVLNQQRVEVAAQSLQEMLEERDLEGRSFLDIGSGSGLFSLAARRMGARVHSFDYDPCSVGCAAELKRRFFPSDRDWIVEQGSVLDGDYMKSLGQFDIVYSWGVLHHTGDMWKALDQAALAVQPAGRLFVALYNDQGRKSRGWTRIKKFYCSGKIARAMVSACFIPYFAGRGLVVDLIRARSPAARYRNYYQERGMSMVHDWFDWLGGFPFEVAQPGDVLAFYRARGFILQRLKTTVGLGNNQFVFERGAGR